MSLIKSWLIVLPGFSTKKQKQTWMWGRKAEEKNQKTMKLAKQVLMNIAKDQQKNTPWIPILFFPHLVPKHAM